MKKYKVLLIIIAFILGGISIINISYAKYQKNLESETVMISSYGYTPITVSLTSDATVENKYGVTITNTNSYSVKVKMQDDADLFDVSIVDSTETYITASPNTSTVAEIQVSKREGVTYDDLEADSSGNLLKKFNIEAKTEKPYDADAVLAATDLSYVIGQSPKQEIINNAGTITESQEGTAYSGVASSSEKGLYSIEVNGETKHYYRGNVTDNYVSFAGQTWRILSINPDGSLKIILDGSIGACKYQSANEPTTHSVDGAIEYMAWENSTVYSTLHTWYDSNIAPNYSQYIIPTKFLFDTSYSNKTASSTNGSVYYFGSYLRVGPDGGSYTPTFSQDANYEITDNIGLINADEVLFAGGFWNGNNTSYFLYNSSITQEASWTMSPSFYDDGAHNKIGMCIINNSTGKLYDWPNSGNTLTDSLSVRPVITISGNYEMTGDGTSSNPYTYK